MTEKEKKEKTEKKPDEEAKGYASAHLVIKDVKTGNAIVNTRG
jgi:hypothetical protein